MLKNNKKLVSIIITCYNYGEYLSDAIHSSLKQTYENIEVIVIDDGSTDETSSVSKSFKNKIKYYFQPNSGVAESRNRGASIAKGDYTIFLDADDRLKTTYVEDCYKVISTSDVGYVFTQVHHFGAENFDTNYPDFNIETLTKSGPYINVSALMKKENFRLAKFNPAVTTGYEDWDFYLSLYEQGIIGKLLDKPLLEYRREENKMHISSKTETLAGMYIAKINIMKLHPSLFSVYSVLKFKIKYWPVAIIKTLKVKIKGLIKR